jgi:hypothetical protein
MRSGLLVNGRFEPLTPKEARSARMIVRLRRASKTGSQEKLLEVMQSMGLSMNAQIGACFAALMLSQIDSEQKRIQKPRRPRKFRIPLDLLGAK